MVFQRSMGDCMLLQVFKNLLSIIANLNNTVVWMVSTLPLIPSPSIFLVTEEKQIVTGTVSGNKSETRLTKIMRKIYKSMDEILEPSNNRKEKKETNSKRNLMI